MPGDHINKFLKNLINMELQTQNICMHTHTYIANHIKLSLNILLTKICARHKLSRTDSLAHILETLHMRTEQQDNFYCRTR